MSKENWQTEGFNTDGVTQKTATMPQLIVSARAMPDGQQLPSMRRSRSSTQLTVAAVIVTTPTFLIPMELTDASPVEASALIGMPSSQSGGYGAG